MFLPLSSLFEFDCILPEKIPQAVTCANFNENCRVNFPDEFHVTKSCFLVKNFPAMYGFQPYKMVKTVRHLSLPWAVWIQCSGSRYFHAAEFSLHLIFRCSIWRFKVFLVCPKKIALIWRWVRSINAIMLTDDSLSTREEGDLPQCHFNTKPRTDPASNPDLPWRKAGDEPPDPWHGVQERKLSWNIYGCVFVTLKDRKRSLSGKNDHNALWR